MNLLLNIWSESSLPRRGLFVGLGLGLLALFAWAVHGIVTPSYQTLFRNLRPQDAATITAELDKQKIKYRLDAGGATILVPESQVHGARIKVLGKDLPLSGTVGFELFNNADLGLTEFAQKVNYQRALQGELARTIMSMEVIESARVHLTLPDSGYLRRATSKPKASVAVALKTAGLLDKSTVRSIQRLVAAAVPDLELSDVAVINQSVQGAHPATPDVAGLSSDPRLEQKFEMEAHYVRRTLAQADKLFGAGRTQVTVDLVLNFDQTKVLNESTSSTGSGSRVSKTSDSRSTSDQSPSDHAAGTQLQVAGPAPAKASETVAPVAKHHSQRRVEETTLALGTIQRINVGALVAGKVDKADLERFKTLVSISIGLDAERGDNIAIFNTDAPPDIFEHAGDKPAGASTPEPTSPSVAIPSSGLATDKRGWPVGVQALALGLLIAVLLAGIWWAWRAHVRRGASVGTPPTLSDEDRARMVRRLSELLQEKAVSP